MTTTTTTTTTTTSGNRAAGGVTVCIGDIHGYFDKLERLWRNLEVRLGPQTFLLSTLIFLGDYCDRGPHTAKVLDFLSSLPARYPTQRHVFLCGNHDFAFAAFLRLLPLPKNESDESDLTMMMKATWDEFAHNQEREGWFSGPGYEAMHVQGRRWGGCIRDKFNSIKGTEYQGSIYDAAPTFASYGLPHAHPGLKDAVPQPHKQFLQDLLWVYEQEEVVDSFGYKKLVAVHAGLEKSKSIESQMENLYKKNSTLPRVEPFSGRRNVWETPPELAKEGVLIVSGHHGALHVDELRLIIDEGGGYPHKPIAAIILPSRVIVRDTDDPPQNSTSNENER